MSYNETKISIIKELNNLSYNSAMESKKLKGEEKETILQISIMLKTIAKSIENNNYHNLMKSSEMIKILAS